MPLDFQPTLLKDKEAVQQPHSSLPFLLFVPGSLQAGQGDKRTCPAHTRAAPSLPTLRDLWFSWEGFLFIKSQASLEMAQETITAHRVLKYVIIRLNMWFS